MATTKEIEIVKCPDCLGDGYFCIDYHDPSDFYGHGQREEQCETCEGIGEIEKEL